MTNFDYMWLRDHMENLIKSLGFKSGYLPDGWQPRNAMESDINDKINALSYRLGEEYDRRHSDTDSNQLGI